MSNQDQINKIRKMLKTAFNVKKHNIWANDPIMCEVGDNFPGAEFVAHAQIRLESDEDEEATNKQRHYWFQYGKTKSVALKNLEKQIVKFLTKEIKNKQAALKIK